MNLNCDHVAELLPWYLNGTLDEGEQGEVRVHLEGCTKCRQALEDTRLAWRIYDQHIPSESLVALAWGETPEGLDPDVLERHLETCPQCAAELEMVRTSRKLEEDDRIALFPTSTERLPLPRPPAPPPPPRGGGGGGGGGGDGVNSGAQPPWQPAWQGSSRRAVGSGPRATPTTWKSGSPRQAARRRPLRCPLR